MIGNKPATFRSPLCVYCGGATTDQSIVVGGYAVVVCGDCDLRNIFSDAWKDTYGFRPRHSTTHRAKRAFLASFGMEF